MRTGEISPQTAGTVTSNATTTSVTKEAENAFSVGNNRICSNRGSGKDRGSDGALSTEDKVSSTKLICYGGGQKQ